MHTDRAINTLSLVRFWAQILRQLFRLELSAMVAISALAGFLFGGGELPAGGGLLCAAVGLLAAGSSALNQWQEQDLDLRMERTRRRPLPEGRLSPPGALLLAALCLAGGILLLSHFGSLPLLLGLLSALWYNAIYTPLKRITVFAALPGAICGALPPLIGWTAAGAAFSPAILILCATLFIWQVPHTWLLLCLYRDDLKRSGLPDLFERITTRRLLLINNCWLGGLLLCYLLFPLFGFISGALFIILFLSGQLLLVLLFLLSQNYCEERRARYQFHLTNISMALLFSVLIFDKLFI